MIKYSVPFLITELHQIPAGLLKKNNLFLEGTIFDCKQLENKKNRDLILRNISAVNDKYKGKLIALHFPTENANYLDSPIIQQKLIDFINVADSFGIEKVVLHSNYIQKEDVYDKNKLESIRKKFNTFFKKLDKFLEDKKTIVCIENMPIIGNDGTDFDSIFVFPQDFSDLKYKNIKITWDIGHWAYTFYFIETLSDISPLVKTDRIRFDDFSSLKKQIAHFHFSSFKKMNNVCQEGVCPQYGDFDQKTLGEIIKKINSDWSDTYMTLEIGEKDYTKRINLKKTLDWIKAI